MKELIDIMGLYTFYGEMFNLDEGWTGKILMNKDLSFEGIVTDNSKTTPYQYDYIVGKIDESTTPVTMDIIKTTEDDKSLPFHYTVTLEDRSFYGDYFVMTEDQSFACGEAKVNLWEADKIREVGKEEIDKVKEGIKKAKANLGPISKNVIAGSKIVSSKKVGIICKELKKNKSN